ncbi:hypothetical protein [Hymenobacter sp. DG01]|uniref:hypothetical protein n=1 Tax=Hymenobacter sp. DG01 TaxID=2584940 RepID=UPI001120FA33|nr:hypothetical protein [Hymenobacter sp. DG01]
MFIEALQHYISQLAISDRFKQQLSAEPTLKAYVFYVELPQYLAPLFPRVSETQLRDLTIYSYLYFSFIVTVDKLVDEPTAGGISHQTRRLFDVLSLQETAVQGLTTLFPVGTPFWAQFHQCKQRYTAANLEEKKYAELRPALTVQQFEHLAAGKSAICFAMVHALSNLGQDTTHVEALLECLASIHIGSQYFDDVEDFAQDWEQKQYTYAHAQVAAYLTNLGIDPEAIPVNLQHRYLYTSGLAYDLMEQGKKHYQHSLELAQRLGLDQLATYLEPQIATYTAQMSRVQQVVARARKAAQDSSTPTSLVA